MDFDSHSSGEGKNCPVSYQYRLTQKILAIQVSPDLRQKSLVYVPAGSVLSLQEKDLPEEHTLVPVQWGTQTVLLFRQDLHSRTEAVTEPLHSATAIGAACAVA